MTDHACSVEGCDRPHLARTYCSMHYQRWQAHGDPLASLPSRNGPVLERFWAKVDKTESCWLWTARCNPKGYGQFTAETGKTVLAHKFSYELSHPVVPRAMFLDHECRTPACVRPESGHLRLVTRKQNREHATRLQVNNKSGVHGVSWHKGTSKWLAQVGHNNAYHHVGYFTDLAEAEAAVIAKRNELFTHNDLDRQAS